MAEIAYIELWASDDSIGGRFDVIREGYRRLVQRKANVEETMNGGIDVQMGGVHTTFFHVIRVAHTDARGSNYGTKDDLEDLYKLNNPNGTPSNVLKYTDHHGNELSVYMLGDFDANLLGCRIEGTEAYWDVQCVFRVIPT